MNQPSQTNQTTVPLLGVPVHVHDTSTVLDAIGCMVEAGRATGRTHQVVTVNTDFVVQAARNPDVHAILRSADLAVADGMPIVWAAAAMGERMPTRVTGADLVPQMATRAASTGWRIMFFGGAPNVADRAAAILRAHNDDQAEIGVVDGEVAADGSTDPAVLDEIRRFDPDILCVALGHPKQERWIRRHAESLGVPVSIGVGGTFDFIAGERKRAHPLIQRVGLEWMVRLAQEPGRLTNRYLSDFIYYVPGITAQLVRTRVMGRQPGPERSTQANDQDPGRLELLRIERDGSPVFALRHPGPIDNRAAIELATVAHQCGQDGTVLRLVAPDAAAMRSIARLKLGLSIRFVVPGPEVDKLPVSAA